MFAHQSGPALNTDTRWLSGHDFTVNPDELEGATLLNEARAAGVSTRGKVYKGGLARFPGDPEAWVESRGDCVRRAEALGLTLEGSINYAPPEPLGAPEDKPYRVADTILEEHYQEALEADPSLATKKDAKEEIAASLSGQT
jgi:hypothetical protein